MIVADEGQNCWVHVNVANEEQDYDIMYLVEGKDYPVLYSFGEEELILDDSQVMHWIGNVNRVVSEDNPA